jgi:hypothetical protein
VYERAELFSLRRPDVCLYVEEAEPGSTHIARARRGLNYCSNFFATPTRLAAGLGTKDYPRVKNASPPCFGLSPKTFGSPAAIHDEQPSVINFSTIE